MTECPECGSPISVAARPMIGEVVACAKCEIECEIVATEPVELVLAPRVEEDWGE